MSGPVRSDDVVEHPEGDGAAGETVEVTPSRESHVGGQRVRRALPRRTRRTVGPWCFADHIGPGSIDPENPFDVGPHPHIGLQTVTWLTDGEILHRDSLGSEQPIRPGQLNLMTAGAGVSHSEEHTGTEDRLHGVQLWVAQPEDTRHGPAEFEHHAELPRHDLGTGVATVLVGTLGEASSPARHDTESVGVELDLRRGETVLPLVTGHEHALVVLQGELRVGDEMVIPGQLCYLGLGRDELVLHASDDTRAVLIGGVPFESRILMWWNFVARTKEEIDGARQDWSGADATRGEGRFGETGSPIDRIPAPETPWRS